MQVALIFVSWVGGRERERERVVNENCCASCIPQLDVPPAVDDDVYIYIYIYIYILLACKVDDVCNFFCLTDESFFLGAFTKFRKATISFVVSVRPSAWNSSALTGRIFMKSDI